MPKFDEPFVSYYELERANLIEQLERMQTGAWKILDHSIDITPERIENTVERLARLDALADTLAAGSRATS
jgi:hypothetical protein